MNIFSEQREMYKKKETVRWPSLARTPTYHCSSCSFTFFRFYNRKTNTRRNLNKTDHPQRDKPITADNLFIKFSNQRSTD